MISKGFNKFLLQCIKEKTKTQFHYFRDEKKDNAAPLGMVIFLYINTLYIFLKYFLQKINASDIIKRKILSIQFLISIELSALVELGLLEFDKS